MCGICMILFASDTQADFITKTLSTVSSSPLPNRGPDVQNGLQTMCSDDIIGLFYGATLHFRGSVTTQPIQDPYGNLLLWNGEIFGGIDVSADENDGVVLLHKLSLCCCNEDILRIFGHIKGPWAFIYWKISSRQLWFGRDVFGRRSLLIHPHSDGRHFMLASVAVKPWSPWHEVPADGLYCASLDAPNPQITTYKWAEPESTSHHTDILVDSKLSVILNKAVTPLTLNGSDISIREGPWRIIPPIKAFNTSLTDHSLEGVISEAETSIDEITSDESQRLAQQLLQLLQDAVAVRTNCQSHLCSDCQHRANTRCSNFQETEGNGVKTTAENKGMLESDTLTCDVQNGVKSLTLSPKQTKHKHCFGSADMLDTTSSVINNQLNHTELETCSLSNNTTSTTTQPESCHDPESSITGSGQHRVEPCTMTTDLCHHTKVAILFSGGVDSLILAALADRCVPPNDPIDLLNVAFQQQPKPGGGGKHGKGHVHSDTSYNVPDRVTGEEGLEELKRLNPKRHWNFVRINVDVEELHAMRTDFISDLLYPLRTVLDDSIGCAIWFATRGRGFIINQSGESVDYTSPARVLLVGMGADEQFAGYSRHRVKFKTDGLPGLVSEIKMEIERISSRNLGRDDRVIADHGRESRLPYLDENVVSFLNELPLSAKTNLHLPRGLGEKFLLRLAANILGLKRGAVAPKRAIQFGSRIAKAEKRKEKGSDCCDRLQE